MKSTTLATEMTTVIREFGTGVENHGRALGASVRELETQLSPAQLLGWIGSALAASSALLNFTGDAVVPRDPRLPCGFTIVDRALTRC